MATKKKVYKAPAKRTTPKRKPGVSIKVKDKKFLKRIAELNLNLVALSEDFLQLFFELQRLQTGAALGLAYEVATNAYYRAADESDDPTLWLKAARKAAGLR